MGTSASSPSTFSIGSHVLVRCEDGPLEVEATVFAATLATRVTTSAGEARARLARSGLTTKFASEALAAIDREALASYARAECVLAVLPDLGPSEVFAGRSYDPDAEAYEGAWLDLRALAADLRVPGAGLLLQGLYLVSMLEELVSTTAITLEHGGRGKAARMAFLKPTALLGALRRLEPRTQPVLRDENEVARAALASSLRDRTTAAMPAARSRHFGIEQGLAAIDLPTRGRLADGVLWTLERQLAANDTRGVLERIQGYVRSNGETQATRYIRAHLALVEGVEPPRRIAEDLLDEGRVGAPFYELELLKARAWMAAGVWTYARHFARSLVDDPNVSDAVSLGAHEIVEAANARGVGSGPPVSRSTPFPEVAPTTERSAPPWSAAPDTSSVRSDAIKRTSVVASPIYVLAGHTKIEPPPSSLELPIDFEEPNSDPFAENRETSIEAEEPTEVVALPPESASFYGTDRDEAPFTAPTFEARQRSGAAIPIDRGHTTDLPPPMQPATRPIAAAAQVPARYVPEDVESLSMPGGLRDEQLAEGVAARSGDEIRIVSTRYARALGREYRERYGVRLRTDAQAVEWMQRHLMTRWGETGLVGPEAIADVRRHGALLSELLARALGGQWVDVTPSEIGYWAMFVPPRTRTWPFGRVYRFLTLGHREKDLVSYYLDLAARARSG